MQQVDDETVKKGMGLMRWIIGGFMTLFGFNFALMPARAVWETLQSGKEGGGFLVLFLGIFIIVGVVIMMQGLRILITGKYPGRQRALKRRSLSGEEDEPAFSVRREGLARRRRQIDSPWGTFIFGLVFVLFGSAFGYFMFVRPVVSVIKAKTWERAPAVVTHSAVESHSDSDGTTYSVDIGYRYQVMGAHYRGDRYHFMGGSSSGYKGKEAIVRRYPVGHEFEVFYDPLSPEESVINREMTAVMWVGLFPAVFIAVGAAIMVSGFKRGRKSLAGQWIAGGGGETVLRPGKGRGFKALGMLVFVLFWNGIVSVFLVQVLKEWQSGDRPIGVSLFLMPFVAVGAGAVIGFVRSLMQLSNPKVVITLDQSPVRLGDNISCRYAIEGRESRLSRLSIELLGREEASYRRGTTTHTERKEFCVIPLVELDLQHGLMSTDFHLRIPAETMHSFEAPNNRVRWQLKVKGDIPNWPDLADAYELTVLPARRG
jgi:hypothetical protein